PCKSPDCTPARDPGPSGASATVSTLWLFLRTCLLSAPTVFPPVVFLPPAFVFTIAFIGAAFFFANFLLGATVFSASLFSIAFFIEVTCLPAVLFDFVCFLLVLL